MMGAPGQMGFDASAAYKFERENLSIAKHEWVAEKAEKTLLGDRCAHSHPCHSSISLILTKPINACSFRKHDFEPHCHTTIFQNGVFPIHITCDISCELLICT